MKRAVLLLLLASLFVLAAPACGDDEEASTELVAHLPDNARSIAAVDFDRARRALDLDDDHDFAETPDEEDDAARRLQLVGSLALLYLDPPREVPLRDAVDHSQIQAAATGGGSVEQIVTVVATDQTLDDLAEPLEGAGYRRRGDLLVSEESFTEVVYPAVGETDGALVMGASEQAVRQALAREDGGGEAADFIETLGEPPVRVAGTLDGSCVRGLAISDELQPARGEVLIFTEDDADAGSVRFEENLSRVSRRGTESVELEDPDTDGDLASLEWSYADSEPSASLTGLVRSGLTAAALYEC